MRKLSIRLAALGDQDRASILRGLILSEYNDLSTDRTLTSADHGLKLYATNSDDEVIALSPQAVAGTEIRVYRMGIGAVSFSTDPGAPALDNLFGYSGIAALGDASGVVVLEVLTNPDGNSARWKLSGEAQ